MRQAEALHHVWDGTALVCPPCNVSRPAKRHCPAAHGIPPSRLAWRHCAVCTPGSWQGHKCFLYRQARPQSAPAHAAGRSPLSRLGRHLRVPVNLHGQTSRDGALPWHRLRSIRAHAGALLPHRRRPSAASTRRRRTFHRPSPHTFRSVPAVRMVSRSARPARAVLFHQAHCW